MGFDISSKYRGKASVQCFIGVSKRTHVAKLAYPKAVHNTKHDFDYNDVFMIP